MLTVSLITTVCNSGRSFLLDTIESARKSIRPLDLLEIIVVNDHSTDDSCHDLSSDITLLQPDERLGCSRARRFGAEYASGEVLIITDPHCAFPPSTLRHLVEAAASIPDAIHVPRIFMRNGSIAPCIKLVLRKRRWGISVQQSDVPLRYPAFYGWTHALSRTALDRLHGIPALPGYWSGYEEFLTLYAYRLGMRILQLDLPWVRPCTHHNYRGRRTLPFTLPSNHRAMNMHYLTAVTLPNFYRTHLREHYNKTGLPHHIPPPPYDEYPIHHSIINQESKRSEQWVLDNVLHGWQRIVEPTA